MTLDVRATIDIARPPADVARYQFDAANDPAWIGGVREVELVAPAPTSVGSRVLRKGGFLGRPIEWLMEVVDHVPERRISMHAVRSPFPMDVTYELEPIERGTRASIRVQGDPRGAYGFAGPLLGPMVRRSVAGDLRRLKRQLEDGR